MKKFIFALLALVVSSCTNDTISEEKKRDMESILTMHIRESIAEQPFFRLYENIEVKLDKVITKEYTDSDGDVYGTYTGDFHYSFKDGLNTVKVYGKVIYSDDGSIAIVRSEPGIMIDMISVNGTYVKDVEDSKYYIDF